MFNSEQLTKQFKARAEEIQPSSGHEDSIRKLYEADQKRRRRSMPVKPVLFKIVLALALFAVISGFSRYIWFQNSDHRTSLQYVQMNTRVDNEELSTKIHRELKEVIAQLKVGESAIVYLPELAKLYTMDKQQALVVVSNPSVVTDFPKWETILAQNMAKYKLPSGRSTGLHFVAGKEDPPFGGFLPVEGSKLLPKLERESEKMKGRAVWRKEGDQPANLPRIYTTIYHNERQDEIYVSMQLIDQKTDFKISTSHLQKEEIDINGARAHYFNTQPFFFSDSNRVQEIQWLETFENYTLVYSVGSTSPTLTKEELLRIARELK
ncbi:DUF4367 domain-containing protein [Paenibacillus aceti]|uniref:DUF4367 domain-containing protein n=1 Tax=Paenibacillus aceti TaxID=1820010 RepID=A0ABQ1VY12_9BACL|nr:DUF4367 domain-containing protein [Paenibacillus aceti]GGG01738.1 hypothetical protein GCM10010913_24280 [Paenibacillus aceti]